MKPADDAKASSNSEAKSSLFNKNTEQSKLFGGKSGEGKESVDSKPSSKPFAGMGSTNDDRRERSNADNEVEKKIEEKKSLFNTVPKKDGAEKSVLGGLNTKIAESEKSDSKTTADAKSLFGVKKSEPSNQIIAKPEDEKKQLSDKSSVKTISGLSDGSKPSPFGQSKAGESSIKNPNVEKVTGNKPFTIGAPKGPGGSSPFSKKDADKKEAPAVGESKAEGENKEKEEEKGDAKKEAPKINEVELIKKMDLNQVKKTSLDSNTLENLFAQWYDRIETQTDSFKKYSKRLKEEELALYDNILTLESLNKYSENVVRDYTGTIGTIEEVAKQQEDLMLALDNIEMGIDEALKNRNQNANSFDFIRGYTPGSHIRYENSNLRQQLDYKTHSVDASLNELEDTVSSLSKVLSLKESESSQSDDYGSMTFDKVVNQAYESLVWIQDNALELNYQIDIIERELESI